MVTTYFDAKAALEIQDSIARAVGIVMSVLIGDVDRYECEQLAMVCLPKIDISVCSRSLCCSTDFGDRKSLR